MSAGRACVSTPFVLPPPRWGRVGVGVMRAECIDPVENRSKPRGGACDRLTDGAVSHVSFSHMLREP